MASQGESALEADDVPGNLAELCGYVNRALPDVELNTFVDKLTRRIVSFDKRVIRGPARLTTGVLTNTSFDPSPEWMKPYSL